MASSTMFPAPIHSRYMIICVERDERYEYMRERSGRVTEKEFKVKLRQVLRSTCAVGCLRYKDRLRHSDRLVHRKSIWKPEVL